MCSLKVIWAAVALVVLGGGGAQAGGILTQVYSRRAPSVEPPCQDCGSPLLLTPLIQAGQIEEAQKLSEVRGDIFLGVRSHAAFLTVDKERGSNSFFWYFPAETNAAAAPVLLWLQGGPGASSLYGLFAEHGPLEFRPPGRLRRRRHSWSASHHVLYIDNPVGSGFSYTTSGYARNQTRVGRDLREAVLQFFQLFPALKKNDFFVTGESYAGKYVPALCRALHEGNNNSAELINLKGFAIGNGFSDPLHQIDYASYLYQHGLLDASARDHFAKEQERGATAIKAKNWLEAFRVFDELLNGDATPYGSLFYNLTGFTNYFNYLSTDGDSGGQFSDLFKSTQFRRALHVGNATFSDGNPAVEENLREDMMQSVAPWLGSLLSSYRGLVYNGQLDIIVAYPLTENMLAHLEFSSAAEYANATRKIWRVGKEIAGYAKVAGNLTELLVRDAGHMVPRDQPRWALDMITRFTHSKPFF